MFPQNMGLNQCTKTAHFEEPISAIGHRELRASNIIDFELANKSLRVVGFLLQQSTTFILIFEAIIAQNYCLKWLF